VLRAARPTEQFEPTAEVHMEVDDVFMIAAPGSGGFEIAQHKIDW
jgi:N-methylhydantoinase B/oxoprolinase/acetone carboxylase alpha subunit